ncbi:MAG: DNA-3-methyladenine glycosylase [Verrucomicrobiota bacterium]
MKNLHETALQHLRRHDEILGSHIDRVGPCALKPRRQSPYRALVQAVVYQQLNGRAARTIFNRLLALFPNKTFPDPADILATPDDVLRSAGLSRSKIAAIKDIAAKTIEGLVPDSRAAAKLSDTEIVERLTAIRGVGPWTVEMLLIFTLGRPDVMPCTDYGVRKGFALLYRKRRLPEPKELLRYSERWRPHRSAAAWYLWRVLD